MELPKRTLRRLNTTRNARNVCVRYLGNSLLQCIGGAGFIKRFIARLCSVRG